MSQRSLSAEQFKHLLATSRVVSVEGTTVEHSDPATKQYLGGENGGHQRHTDLSDLREGFFGQTNPERELS